MLLHAEHLPYTFPSEYTLMATAVYGFIAFLLIRHLKNPVGRVFVGISRLYFKVEYPSDITAGYVFGGVWLSLNIVLLEINRLLRMVRAVNS